MTSALNDNLNNITLREASLDDLPQLLVLEQKIIESERPYDAYIKENDVSYYDLDRLISDADSTLVVAMVENDIVGCGYAQIRPSKPSGTHEFHCYLGFIYVEEQMRDKRIASCIVNNLIDWGKARGMQHIHLDVYAANESAIRAYEKAGFKKLAIKMELVV